MSIVLRTVPGIISTQKMLDVINLKNAKGNPAHWNERMLDSNRRAYKNIKLTGKSKSAHNTEYYNTVMLVHKSLLILV